MCSTRTLLSPALPRAIETHTMPSLVVDVDGCNDDGDDVK